MELREKYEKKKILKTISEKLSNNKIIFTFLFQLFFLHSSLGFCGFISISTTANTSYFDKIKNEAILSLIIKNLGNEAAFDLQVEIISNYFDGKPISIGNIQPNEEKEIKIRLVNKKEILPGSYYIGILIKYKDANNYEFSLVTFAIVINEIESYPSIYASLNSISILNEGELKLKVYNPNEEDKKINIKLFLPQEFSGSNEINDAVLPKNSEKEFYFKIKNLKGLVGSNYFVFALLEEEKEVEGKRVHASLVAGANVAIAEQFYSRSSESKKDIFLNLPIQVKISITTIIILLFLFIYLSLKERLEEKKIKR
ncbi:MAG: hypothetical protein KQA36_03485 [Candidatus Aenigmarchaeota archaeon]|nr:hypothetical protein [Candidatus Aenigmarchaeota archaeon]